MRHGVKSITGVVFTSDYLTKDEVLKKYLNLTNFTPKSIVFINESKTNLNSVSQVLNSKDLKTHALFYPLVKRDIGHWDKYQAKLEWEKRHGKVIYN